MAGSLFGSIFGKDDEDQVVGQPLPVGINPTVPEASSIDKLYGDKYSNEARDKLVQQNADAAKGPNFLAGLAALGAGLQGKDAATAGVDFLKNQQAQRDADLSQFDKARAGLVADKELGMKLRDDADSQEKLMREKDPMSAESQSAQALAIKMGMKPELASRLTAAQWKSQGPMYQTMYEIDQKAKDRADARKDKLDLAMQKKNEGLTAGRVAADKDFAKDYNDWTGSGAAGLEKNMARLLAAKSKLAEQQNDFFTPSGRVVGYLPDALRTENSKVIQQDVQAAAQGALKAALGSQFTEKEGERIMKAAYDPTLSPKENLKKIDAALNELSTIKSNKDAKSRYFEKNGTLTGFKAGNDAPTEATASNAVSAKDKQALDWANANPNDPRAAAIKKKLGV